MVLDPEPNESCAEPALMNVAPGVILASDTETAEEEAPTRSIGRIVQALRHSDFRLFWAGNFLSNIGTWMQNVAQGWLVLKLTNSAVWLGLVGFASTIPILFLALIGGVIADRVNNRKLLIGTQSVMMLSAFSMAILTWTHHITAHRILWLAIVTGLSMSLNTPSYQALVPQLVPREDLINAIALNSAQFNMSRVIGPMLGGFAMALVGEGGNFFLNGLSFLAVIVALTRINHPSRVQEEDEGHLLDKLKQGFAYVFEHQQMKPLIALTAIASLLAIPYLVFVPYFARDILHSGERGLGVLMACSGIGAFFGAVTIAYTGRTHHRGYVVVGFGAAFYSAIILFTFSHIFWLSGLFLGIAGYAMVLMIATVNALLQHLAEETMRGRVMSMYSTAFLGLPPIGSLAAALLSRIVTPAHAIAIMSALALLGTWAVFAGNDELRILD